MPQHCCRRSFFHFCWFFCCNHKFGFEKGENIEEKIHLLSVSHFHLISMKSHLTLLCEHLNPSVSPPFVSLSLKIFPLRNSSNITQFQQNGKLTINREKKSWRGSLMEEAKNNNHYHFRFLMSIIDNKTFAVRERK